MGAKHGKIVRTPWRMEDLGFDGYYWGFPCYLILIEGALGSKAQDGCTRLLHICSLDPTFHGSLVMFGEHLSSRNR